MVLPRQPRFNPFEVILLESCQYIFAFHALNAICASFKPTINIRNIVSVYYLNQVTDLKQVLDLHHLKQTF